MALVGFAASTLCAGVLDGRCLRQVVASSVAGLPVSASSRVAVVSSCRSLASLASPPLSLSATSVAVECCGSAGVSSRFSLVPILRFYPLQRTGYCPDAACILIRQPNITLHDIMHVRFHDVGNRVAILVALVASGPLACSPEDGGVPESVVNECLCTCHLAALHDAGALHRDVLCSNLGNVLVA